MLKKKLSKKQEEFFLDVYKTSLVAMGMPKGPNSIPLKPSLLVEEAVKIAAKSVDLIMNEDGIKAMDQIKEELEIKHGFPEIEQE